MKITWCLADAAELDPTIEVGQLKNIGPIWGGWRTWRSWNTDNVVCHDLAQARNLVTRNFHTRCNMYLPSSSYQELDRPVGVKLYQGDFHQLVDSPDDIVSMHLAGANSDIVLLVGFDLQPKYLDHDKMAKHKWHNYKQYVLHLIKDNPGVQWVILDHPKPIEKELQGLPNLLFDTLSNVLTQFS
jgi:hypothetical protein